MVWKVSDCIHPLSSDIDPTGGLDVKLLDASVNKCVQQAEEALMKPAGAYDEFQRWHLAQIYSSMKHTHFSIRLLVQGGSTDLRTVDSLCLARLQVETIFNLCLMLESTSALSTYLKDAWKKQYIRFLVEREECNSLPRFKAFLFEHALPLLEKLQEAAGVSAEERQTIEADHVGTAQPIGRPQRIHPFPTPAKAMGKVTCAERKRMLCRLYPEYNWLCAFAHGSPLVSLMKATLDPREQFRKQFTSSQIEETWRKEVGERSVFLSCLAVVQCSTELIALYPGEIELCRVVIEAWNLLYDQSLLARTLWEVRSKALLGVIDPR